jgi:hypothetical protein
MAEITATEVRNTPAGLAARANVVFSRTIKMTLNALVAGTHNLVGLALAPGTVVLGGFIKPSATLGTSTLALKCATSGVTFVAAATVAAERGLAIAAASTLAVPTSATVDDQVQLVSAVATTPASDIEVEVTLILAQVGEPNAGMSTYTN